MKGKAILVVLAFLLLAGTLYADRINSDDVEIRRMYPNGTISNCGTNGPSEVDFEIWILKKLGRVLSIPLLKFIGLWELDC